MSRYTAHELAAERLMIEVEHIDACVCCRTAQLQVEYWQGIADAERRHARRVTMAMWGIIGVYAALCVVFVAASIVRSTP